ncbi:hypothetical protein BH18ACT11_BH18ACT11_12320 [soil metagenome]
MKPSEDAGLSEAEIPMSWVWLPDVAGKLEIRQKRTSRSRFPR